MYEVKLINGVNTITVHSENQKLNTGKVAKGINCIDSFSFSMLPNCRGFNEVHDFQTLVSVYNKRRKRVEFLGRVYYSRKSMTDSGEITKEAVCESLFGYFCDSVQDYVPERDWTVQELVTHIIENHNSKVEAHKRFKIGRITVTDPNDNIYIGIQRKNTWDTIQDKLIKKLGGEIYFYQKDGKLYFEYLEFIGETKTTAIEVSRNMCSISKEDDPSAYISRLYPLGAKIKDEEGNDTEERFNISGVNNGLLYIEDKDAIKQFGIRCAFEIFDNITDSNNLLQAGLEWLMQHNRVKIKYSVVALDLSLLGLDLDDFEVFNRYPLKNKLLGIGDTARIIKKTIDICEPTKSSMEFGDNFQTLAELQSEQAGKVEDVKDKIEKIESDYVTNETLKSELTETQSLIEQTADNILLAVENSYSSKSETEELKKTLKSELTMLSDEILFKFTKTNEEIEKIDGVTNSRFEQLYKYISTSDKGVIIGSNTSQIKLQVDNEAGIIFSKNGVPFGHWDGENFYTGNIVVRVSERAQFGNFAFTPRTDGSLSLLKVGGG